MAHSVNILISEEKPVLRDGLRRLLEGETGFEVVGAVQEASEATPLLTETRPDLILLGTGSATEPPLAAVRRLSALVPAVRVLLIGDVAPPVSEFLLAGARGVVRTAAGPDELFKAIRTVAKGQYWVGREAFDEVVQHLRKHADSGLSGTRDVNGLTVRERQVAVGVARGESNREIASRLGLSEATIKGYLTAIFARLGVANRAELSAWTIHSGLVD